MSNPFQATVAEFNTTTPSENPTSSSSSNGVIDQLFEEINSRLLNQLNSWNKEPDPDTVFQFIEDYFTFLENKENLLKPIISKVYGTPAQDSFMINMYRSHNSPITILNEMLHLKTNNLSNEEISILNLLKLKASNESQSFLVPVMTIINNLPENSKNIINNRYQKAIEQYRPKQNPVSEGSPEGGNGDGTMELPLVKKNVPKKQFIIGISILLCILFVLGLLYYFYYCRGSSSSGESLSDSSSTSTSVTGAATDNVSIPST